MSLMEYEYEVLTSLMKQAEARKSDLSEKNLNDDYRNESCKMVLRSYRREIKVLYDCHVTIPVAVNYLFNKLLPYRR